VTTPTSATASPPGPISSAGGRYTRAILAIVLISYFMILLDNSTIFTALPKIHTAMRVRRRCLVLPDDGRQLRRRDGHPAHHRPGGAGGAAGHNLTSPAAVLTAHVNTALATGSVLLALCLVVTLALAVPVELPARRGRRTTTVPAAAAATPAPVAAPTPAPVAAAAARDWPVRDDEGIASCRS
jgi:hypothetical protein